MGINLHEEAARFRSDEGSPSVFIEGAISAARPFDVRAYRVANPALFNQTIKVLEALPSSPIESSRANHCRSWRPCVVSRDMGIATPARAKLARKTDRATSDIQGFQRHVEQGLIR
jgi:hypothetical protein